MSRANSRFAVLVGLTLWYGVVGHMRCDDWTSELNLWTRATITAPMHPIPHINRAKALYGLGRINEAMVEIGVAAQLEGK